ncbi:hypothetical protein BaRGS_00011402, partial [Batillaria attramentaria]
YLEEEGCRCPFPARMSSTLAELEESGKIWRGTKVHFLLGCERGGSTPVRFKSPLRQIAALRLLLTLRLLRQVYVGGSCKTTTDLP